MLKNKNIPVLSICFLISACNNTGIRQQHAAIDNETTAADTEITTEQLPATPASPQPVTAAQQQGTMDDRPAAEVVSYDDVWERIRAGLQPEGTGV